MLVAFARTATMLSADLVRRIAVAAIGPRRNHASTFALLHYMTASCGDDVTGILSWATPMRSARALQNGPRFVSDYGDTLPHR